MRDHARKLDVVDATVLVAVECREDRVGVGRGELDIQLKQRTLQLGDRDETLLGLVELGEQVWNNRWTLDGMFH